MSNIDSFKRIAEVEFTEIVKDAFFIDYKIRVTLVDNSFIDVHSSQKIPDKFSFHWECMSRAGTFYRYDNFPDKKWKSVSTYPYHFHVGSQNNVEASPFPLKPVDGFRAFMEFVRNEIRSKS